MTGLPDQQAASSASTGASLLREVTIPGDVALEGLLEFPEDLPPLGGVVVAHPHPLHGSTMQQPVVHHVAKACRRRGLATLRFNFRGVGASEGAYNGMEEFRDVRAAAAFLRAQLPPALPISLAGYSFGAVMASLAVIDGEPAAALALVAFPLRWDEFAPRWFERFGEFNNPVISVCGENDTVAPPAAVEAFLRGVGLDPTMVVVPGADHFFGGERERFSEPIAEFLHDASPA
ncbi:MAG: alpha/beta hydrolase [Thermoleophilia bacterium]